MKKSLLAVAIPAILATQAQAVELYNDGKSTLTLGGHITVMVDDKSGDAELNDGTSRINLAFDTQLGNGFTGYGKVEQAVNLVESGDGFKSRLGYVGVKHDDYGSLTMGKQWGVFYDAEVVTDYPFAFYADHGGIYSFGADGGESGMGRADKAVVYRNGFDLGNAGALEYGLQWQGTNGAFDDRFGGSLAYLIGDFRFTTAYYGGDVNEEVYGIAKGESVDGTAFSVAYGTWGKGFYAAATYSLVDNTEAGYRFVGEGEGFESTVAYGTENGHIFHAGYRFMDSKDEIQELGRKYSEEDFIFGVAKSLTNRMQTFVEYRISMGDDTGSAIGVSDNAFAIGLRYYL